MSSQGIVSPPSPLGPMSRTRSNLPMLYYGLIVVGTAAVVLALYNLLVLRWCSDRRSRTPANPNPFSEIAAGTRPAGAGVVVMLPAGFRYCKEKTATAADWGGDEECAVCLSALEEGEEVRRLPRCRHVFHAPCIDMWLFSHADCPLCRTPVFSGGRRCGRHAPPLEMQGSV